MDPKPMKRRHFQVVKNDLGVELTKLTNASIDLNSRLQMANEVFENMFNSINERQVEIVQSCRLLEDKYRAAIRVLEDKHKANEDESGGENEVLPRGYAEDVKKFVSDCRDSLNSHGLMMENECATMDGLFKRCNNMLQSSINELNSRGEDIGKLRTKLRCKLSVFGRTEVESSDSE